jgi:hypothetical protein
MITVFHGDNQVLSRQALPPGTRYQAKNLTPEKLEQILTGDELFGGSEPIIIEGLIDLPQTKKEVYLWVNKKLSAAQLKKFAGAKIQEFKLPQALWRFLSTLKLNDLEETLTTQPVELVWYLLHRQAAKKQNLSLLNKMFSAELNVKSGRGLLDQKAELEFILMGL